MFSFSGPKLRCLLRILVLKLIFSIEDEESIILKKLKTMKMMIKEEIFED